MKYLLLMLLCFFSLLAPATVSAKARPLLDIVDVLGVRENQLVGYGLVVGLPGSGDKAQVKFAGQSLSNMLKQFGVSVDEERLPKSKKYSGCCCPCYIAAYGKPRPSD
jgi:flagellar P-ring protein precursor FlgI